MCHFAQKPHACINNNASDAVSAWFFCAVDYPPLRICLEMALKAGTTYKYKDSRQFSSDSRRDKTLAITPNIHHAREYVNYTPP